MESDLPMTYSLSTFTRNSQAALLFLMSGFSAYSQQALIPVEGTYTNHTYEYSVALPKGISAFHTKPPAPDHGILVFLDDDRQLTISIDASYNTLNLKTAREATLEELRSEDCKSPTLWEGFLGDLPASYGEIRCTLKSGNVSIRRVVTALRNTSGPIGVIYQAELQTNPRRYDADRLLFSRLIQSVKFKVP